jgi:hypothetical protein
VLQPSRDGSGRYSRRIYADAIPEPGNDLPVVARTIGNAWALFSRSPNVCASGKIKPCRHDTDNRAGLTVHPKSGQRKIGHVAEVSAPESIADDGDSRATFTKLFGREPTPRRWKCPEDIEKVV